MHSGTVIGWCWTCLVLLSTRGRMFLAQHRFSFWLPMAVDESENVHKSLGLWWFADQPGGYVAHTSAQH